MIHRSAASLASTSMDSIRSRNPNTKMATIQPTVMSAAIDQRSLQERLDSLLARTVKEEESHTPWLPRKWVECPQSLLSTSATRRNWFRVMNFNMMANCWGDESKTRRVSPVQGVAVRIPSFTRQQSPPCCRSTADATSAASDHSDAHDTIRTNTQEGRVGHHSGSAGGCSPPPAVEDYCTYDPAVDRTVPHFLTDEYRRKHLMNLLHCYDPDLVCLNEVSKTFFNGDLWRYARFLGYGTLYQSSRGARVSVLRRGADPTLTRNKGKLSEDQDIGNVILFHKGRFLPILQPGPDLSKHFHFGHMVCMRDEVTNKTLVVACVQYTAGDTALAQTIRQHEAQQTLMLMDAICANDADRGQMSFMICGDLNTTTDEEPCVQLIRDRLFSTHDVVGGPRWTTWHHRDAKRGAEYDTYFMKNLEEMKRSSAPILAAENVRRFARSDGRDHGTASLASPLLTAASEKYEKRTNDTQQPLILKPWRDQPHRHETNNNTQQSKIESDSPATAAGAPTKKEDAAAPPAAPAEDKLALVKSSRLDRGVVYNTQDYIFYDPETVGLHRVLDVPADTQVNEAQLFPNNALPSHHLPLLIDISFNAF